MFFSYLFNLEVRYGGRVQFDGEGGCGGGQASSRLLGLVVRHLDDLVGGAGLIRVLHLGVRGVINLLDVVVIVDRLRTLRKSSTNRLFQLSLQQGGHG